MRSKAPKKAHRILGVDPGTNIMGYALIELHQRKINPIVLGVIRMEKFPNHHKKLEHILVRLQDIIEEYKPHEMAIEAPFYGKNVQSMLKLGRAQGVAIAAGINKGLEVTEYSPRKIKQSVTGNGNASKEQVLGMLEQITKKKLDAYTLDASDALAAAVCHHYQSSSVLKGQKRYNDWSDFIKDKPDRLA